MSFHRMLGLSFIISLVVWAWFSWPLPRYVAAGIPAAANRGKSEIQRMVPGDHLQFMYYCRLAGDMVAGKTPLFYNLYEFNTGNDRERFEPDAYYIPFSLIYAAGAALGGQAFGWNLAGFISIWFTYLLTWLLVRRWTVMGQLWGGYSGGSQEPQSGAADAVLANGPYNRKIGMPSNQSPQKRTAPLSWIQYEWLAAATALLGMALPFRWISLFGGSPAGFAMVWIPAILLGVDLAVREDRVKGGALAGAAMLMAAWGDQHVFFFGVLAAPIWGGVAFAARPDFQWRQIAAYRRLVMALLPILLFAGAALLFPLLMKWLYRAVTGLAPVAHAVGPRTLRDVLLFAPDWQGFAGINTRGASAHIYLGVLIPAFIAAGWLALLGLTVKQALFRRENFTPGSGRCHAPADKVVAALGLSAIALATADDRGLEITTDVTDVGYSKSCPRRGPNSMRTLLILTLIVLSMLGIMILALGPRGPEDGLLFRIGRRLIPPYALIRQPAKIFCLLPSFLAVASAIALMALVQLRAGRLWRILLPAVFAGILLLDYARQTHPTISLLDKKQDAYAAVAADAAAGQAVPRALVLPLWPGDSHYASTYQYFAALYRVRMINGYNPFIKRGYFENVFCRFESVNQGGLSGEQIGALQRMGVRYIILHENMFPEKVSPFPVTATLEKLLSHSQLELLCQDGSVWAFRIREAPRAHAQRVASAPDAAPGWQTLFPARRFEMEKASAERRVTVKLDSGAGGRAYVVLEEPGSSLKTDPIRVAAVSNLHWLVRARGMGTLAAELTGDQNITTIPPIAIQSDDWTWLNVPVPDFRGFAALSLKLALQSGAVDLDLSLLTAGPWPLMNPGESVILPAPLFFHAGYADLKSGGVVFRRDYDPQGFVLYGPKLPLPRGTYEINITFTSPAAPGAELGVINLEQNEALVEGVGAARPVRAIFAGRPARVYWRQDENLPFNLALDYKANADLEIQRITIKRLE